MPGAGLAFGTVFGIFAACLLLGWPVFRIITLWFDRQVTTGEALGALFLVLVFLMGIMSTWGQPANLVLWLLLAGLSLTFTVGARHMERRRRDRFFEDDVATAQHALVAHPDNAVAHMRLGGLYASKGDYEEAVKHYEETVRLVPRDGEARLALANAIEKRRLAVTGNLTCWQCGRENARDAGRCGGCGAVISDRNQVVAWLTSRAVSVMLMVVGGLLIAATVAASIGRAPVVATVTLYGLLFLVVLCYLYPRWVRARRDGRDGR